MVPYTTFDNNSHLSHLTLGWLYQVLSIPVYYWLILDAVTKSKTKGKYV